MSEIRKPNLVEIKLLKFLIERSSERISMDLEKVLVKSMSDGGMRSLLLLPERIQEENRIFSKSISEYQFTDVDGVEVIINLNLDQNNELFELDIWKTDFSPLIKIPKEILEDE